MKFSMTCPKDPPGALPAVLGWSSASTAGGDAERLALEDPR